MTQYRKLLLLLVLIVLFMPARIAFADTGPKPTMEFEFKQESLDGQVTILSGIMYECEQSDCSDAAPLQELGPQRFVCEGDLSCRALAYGFSPYHKLEMEFSDGKTRESNIFETAGFNSKYTVTIRPDDLVVDAHLSLGIFPPVIMILAVCLCVFIAIGLLIVLTIFIFQRSRMK